MIEAKTQASKITCIFTISDMVDWLSGCKYGFMPYLQNNWTLHVSKERTIRTQMNTDEHG